MEDLVEDKDSTDGLGDTNKNIFQPILDEFKDLIGENEDKRPFIGGLIKILTILLSLRSRALAKIKRVIRISTKIALDLRPEQKLQSEDGDSQRLLLHQVRELETKNIMNIRNSMFKIKILLPQTLQVEVKKNGQVLRRMNIRRKSHYFSGNRRLHCVKSVQIRNFFWSIFSRSQTEYGEILRISPYSVRMWENTDQEKLRTWTFFTQC